MAATEDWAGLPDRAFHIDLGFFDRLLSRLVARGWSVVTLEEATARAARDAPGDRYVNFSLDDCYRDAAEGAAPLFRRHGLPFTLFVATGIPDGTLPLWHAGLELALSDRSRVLLDGRALDVASPARKRRAFRRIASVWDGPLAAARFAAFCAENGLDAEALRLRSAVSWDMLARLAADPLVEIGAHTMSHPRLSELPPDEALREMAGSRARLAERLGVPVRHLAFPYGRSGDCGPREAELARRAGFASASTTRKGLVVSDSDPFSLPRNTLNGSHRRPWMAEVHLNGLSGRAARLIGHV